MSMLISLFGQLTINKREIHAFTEKKIGFAIYESIFVLFDTRTAGGKWLFFDYSSINMHFIG